MIGHEIGKATLGRLAAAANLGDFSGGHTIVLNAHRPVVPDLDRFMNMMRERYRFASLDEVRSWRFETTRLPVVVLTFDDGFAGDLAAGEYLAARNVGAVFFVVPAFTESTHPIDFYSTHITRPSVNWSRSDLADVLPLSRQDIRTISSLGHVVGSHTMSHLLHPAMHRRDLLFQIRDSKHYLEDLIQQPVGDFAGPFSSQYLTVDSIRIVHAHYERNHLTYPGTLGSTPAGVVPRIHVEPAWPPSVVEYKMRLQVVEGRRYRSRWREIQSYYRTLSGCPTAHFGSVADESRGTPI